MPQIVEVPRATQQINIDNFYVRATLFHFLRVQHRRHNLPVLCEQKTIRLDRAKEIFNVIVRDKVMPAIIERPIGGESYCTREQYCNCSDEVRPPNRHGLEDGELDQPTDAKSSGNRDRNKCRQIVRILVLRDVVAERVSQIGSGGKQEKPKSCAVPLESAAKTGEG